MSEFKEKLDKLKKRFPMTAERQMALSVGAIGVVLVVGAYVAIAMHDAKVRRLARVAAETPREGTNFILPEPAKIVACPKGFEYNNKRRRCLQPEKLDTTVIR